MSGFYPAEMLAEARRLWDEGVSFRLIGAQFGLSKNVIAGIATRQGWPRRIGEGERAGKPVAQPINQAFRGAKAVQKALEASERVQRAPAPPKPPKPAYVAPKLSSVAVCQWIEGDHRGPMCCKPAVLGESWCPEHGRRVFLGRGERRLEAA